MPSLPSVARDPQSQPNRHTSERGQVIAIFAGALLLFTLVAATVIDLSWYWTNNLRMQRAADAAALAGVVFLPGDTTSAYAAARAEAAKNGFADGVGGVVVTPVQDSVNPRRLKVSISGPINTYFARVVGIPSWPARRDAKADFVLPVPMGSPQNYYGVGYLIKPVTTTTTSTTSNSGNSGNRTAGGVPSNVWYASSGSLSSAVASTGGAYAYTTTDGAFQQFESFDLLTNLTASDTITDVNGLRVQLNNVRLSGSCSNTNIEVAVSWDGGGTWTTSSNITGNLTTSNQNFTFGSTSSTSAWTAPGLDWDSSSETKLGNGNFQVRLTAHRGCGTAVQIRVDQITVRVEYDYDRTTTTTTTTLQQQDVDGPGGQSLVPQNFWGAMNSQGSPSIQGDAYMTRFETRKSSYNAVSGTDPDAQYLPDRYYNYAVEIPAGGTNDGAIWVYDPGFCDATSSAGTGEYYTTSSSNTGGNGSSTRNGVSAFFDVYWTRETALNLNDDQWVAGTGNAYQRLNYQDQEVYNLKGQSTSVADCSGQSWHFGWVQIASGLQGGRTYRIHTTSTDPNSANDQDDATGLNAFAFYASSSNGTPRIYGIGAMEAYVRLPGGGASEFYLAQIDAVHAGKTMIINLWDPGDTGSLSANLQILKPTGSGFTPATFTYRGTQGTSNSGASSCGSQSGSNVTSVTTNTGGSSLYNGCWLTIEIPLPTTYDAPVDPVSGEAGWWKIRYNMGGSTSNFSTDMTTWQVSIRGNPVHLVLP